MNATIERMESEVRSYCRSFPTVFARAEGSTIHASDGREYLDFFAGAGALNYGHNDPVMKEALLEYISSSGISHGLDMATEAKCAFLESFEKRILAPRKSPYKVMFPGPTGTNAVEAALKLARKVTGRSSVIAFSNAFHGMTLGSLALTGNETVRAGAGVDLGNVVRMPYCGYLGSENDSLDYIETFLEDPSSGVDAPAAFIVETVQGEGGINVASGAWLRRLQEVARQHDALLIIDDIQVGCGRTGPFFSFEKMGIHPDIVCLSKSLSGYGLPFSLLLFRSELDRWTPGEHNGTFRGNNLAFVTATAALEHYWKDDALSRDVAAKATLISQRLRSIAGNVGAEHRGRGLIQGLAFDRPSAAKAAAGEAFRHGLLIECAGPRDEVLKLLPPLTIDRAALTRGLDIIEDAIQVVDRNAHAHAPYWRQIEEETPRGEVYQ
jgi:diaminobutyrate-2-oxoglutarate transaminase